MFCLYIVVSVSVFCPGLYVLHNLVLFGEQLKLTALRYICAVIPVCVDLCIDRSLQSLCAGYYSMCRPAAGGLSPGHLTTFFTQFGMPKEIESDQGSNFTSGIFQQVMHQLGIRHVVSSAYHPQSHGALGRYHQTLKTMIKAYGFENEKDWDEGIHLLLFATRGVVQDSRF